MRPHHAASAAPPKPFQERAWIVVVIGMSAVILHISGGVLFIARKGSVE